MSLYESAKDLHDYLRANVPDIIDISTSSQLAGDGVTRRLQALNEALKLASAPTIQDLWPTCADLALRDIALTEAAHDLMLACDMEQHNEDIFKGKWKKGSKAWSGEFISRTKKEAMERIRVLTDPRKPPVRGYLGSTPDGGIDDH